MLLFFKEQGNLEFVGVELLWGKCSVFPDLGTDRWRINLHLCATCQYPLNRNWKNCAIAPKKFNSRSNKPEGNPCYKYINMNVNVKC
jgi:hypothetical protein